MNTMDVQGYLLATGTVLCIPSEMQANIISVSFNDPEYRIVLVQNSFKIQMFVCPVFFFSKLQNVTKVYDKEPLGRRVDGCKQTHLHCFTVEIHFLFNL